MAEQLSLPEIGPPLQLTGPAPTVRARVEIEQLRAAGYGWADVARSLNARGVPTPSGRGRWWPETAKRHTHPDAWRRYIARYRAAGR